MVGIYFVYNYDFVRRLSHMGNIEPAYEEKYYAGSHASCCFPLSLSLSLLPNYSDGVWTILGHNPAEVAERLALAAGRQNDT